ncbi:MAG: hypothetical protein LBN98_06155 [Prevotellaceae bacterium]|nr:hypothetical protein [Prevotellaceae bacterium]
MKSLNDAARTSVRAAVGRLVSEYITKEQSKLAARERPPTSCEQPFCHHFSRNSR